MESGAEDQIDSSLKFFYATMCHVCKRFGDNIPLNRCCGCKMLAYFSKEHQKQHWAEHKTLCKAVQNLLSDMKCSGCMETRGVTWEKRLRMKLNMIQLVSKYLKRPLVFYEKQMFKFPRECVICYEQDIKSLVDCRNCAVSFCNDHKDDTSHKEICAPLELCLRINLLSTCLESSMDLDYLQHVSSLKPFQDMNEFMSIYGKIRTCSRLSYEIMVANHSEYFTRPLTLFHTMQILNFVPKRKKLVIHIVAASSIEEFTLRGWEALLHLIETDISLVIVMIGMELKCKSHLLSVCKNCTSRGRKISVECHRVLYEDYIRNPSSIKPDIAVGFDAGIREFNFKSDLEMWNSSIQMLGKQDCPFLLTWYTELNLEEQANRINTILNRKVDYIYKGKNPFAGLRPYRSIGPEKIFFQNNYIIVYRSLYSSDINNLTDTEAVFDAEENVAAHIRNKNNTN